jgi:hypothetical protein
MLTLAIYYNPQLNVHPMNIVMAISFLGAAIFFAYFFGNGVCYFELYKLMAGTLFFRWGDPYYDYMGALVLWASCVFLSVFLLNAMLMLNIFLAVDLVYMIKYPFRPKSSKGYLAISSVISVIAASLNWLGYHNDYRYREGWLSLWLMFVSLVYLITAAGSILYASRKLRKPGISQEVREIVFRRHVIQIIVFIFSYLYFFASVGLLWLKEVYPIVNIHSTVLSILKVSFVLQGVYYPLCRITEPAFYKLLRKRIDSVIFRIVFRRPEPLTDMQQICVNSLCNRFEEGKCALNKATST